MIVVLLSRPRSFDLASWLIRKATSFDASHASIHMQGRGLFSGEHMVFESTSHGIGLTHPSIWDQHNLPVHAFEMVEETDAGAAALGQMWTLLGADYDYKGLFNFAMRLLAARLFGIELRAPDTPTTMFCSELVARWLNAVRTQLGQPEGSLRPDEVSPAGLVKELERSELFRSIQCGPSSSAIFT